MLPTEHHPFDSPDRPLTLSGARPGPGSSAADGETQHHESRLWLLCGSLLLGAGGIALIAFLSASQVAGGCCSGGLLVIAGGIFLVIGVRDRGEFSR